MGVQGEDFFWVTRPTPASYKAKGTYGSPAPKVQGELLLAEDYIEPSTFLHTERPSWPSTCSAPKVLCR